MTEKFFWADKIAEEIIKRNKDKKEYVCASGTTPSGVVHTGNFREAITTDLEVKALKDKGKKVKFIFSWDDFDRFRKVPVNIPDSRKKEYEKYIGMPVSDIPSPFSKNKSYAEYFEEKFENELKEINIEPIFIRQSKMYRACKYAKEIKIALDNTEKIKKILDKYREEPLSKDWNPISIYCEKCNKDSTKVVKIDGYKIEYECECKFKNKIDYRKKGIVKLVWRVDWPMRWAYEDLDFEPGGIDHSTPGGSYDTAKQIVKEVYEKDVPFYQLYEWIKIKGGKEFSSSSGNALSLSEVLEVYEPEVIRYLFAGTRPNRGFQVSFDNDVIKIYEDFDSLEKKYYDNKATEQEKRIYEMSNPNAKKDKKVHEKISFRHLITLVQINQTKDLNNLSKYRAEKVKNWLNKYAGEDMKFRIYDTNKVELSEKQKEALLELKNSLKKKKMTETELFNEFYEICKNVEISNTEFFEATYKLIINKTKGPRLAALILDIGKEKIIKILNQIK